MMSAPARRSILVRGAAWTVKLSNFAYLFKTAFSKELLLGYQGRHAEQLFLRFSGLKFEKKYYKSRPSVTTGCKTKQFRFKLSCKP